MDKREVELNSRIQELEKRVKELTNQNLHLVRQVDEYRKKEESISRAILQSMEHANQLESSRKRLYLLDIQRSRLLYLRLEQIINELYRKYPDLKNDNNLKDMTQKFKSMVYADINEKSKNSMSFDFKRQSTISDDPIKKLLHNIIDCFDNKKVDNIDIVHTDYDDKVSEASTGFDFNEALHPTMSLDEIMKSFNLGEKKKKKNENK